MFKAGRLGIEPRLMASKATVLPLDDLPIRYIFLNYEALFFVFARRCTDVAELVNSLLGSYQGLHAINPGLLHSSQ